MLMTNNKKNSTWFNELIQLQINRFKEQSNNNVDDYMMLNSFY